MNAETTRWVALACFTAPLLATLGLIKLFGYLSRFSGFNALTRDFDTLEQPPANSRWSYFKVGSVPNCFGRVGSDSDGLYIEWLVWSRRRVRIPWAAVRMLESSGGYCQCAVAERVVTVSRDFFGEMVTGSGEIADRDVESHRAARPAHAASEAEGTFCELHGDSRVRVRLSEDGQRDGIQNRMA